MVPNSSHRDRRHPFKGNRFPMLVLEAFVLCRFLFSVHSSPTTTTTTTTMATTNASNTTEPITAISQMTNTNWSASIDAPMVAMRDHATKHHLKHHNETMRLQVPSYDVLASNHPMRYYMSYACERDQLRLSCDHGHVLLIVRANYGRHSFSTCRRSTKQGQTLCTGSFTHAKKVLHRACTGHQHCTVPVISRLFGNPCAKVSKYLEVYFGCVKEEMSTTTASEDWRIY